MEVVVKSLLFRKSAPITFIVRVIPKRRLIRRSYREMWNSIYFQSDAMIGVMNLHEY